MALRPTIPVSCTDIGGKSALCVNARDLHRHLAARSLYLLWIESHIMGYGLIEGRDYVATGHTGHFWGLEIAQALVFAEGKGEQRSIWEHLVMAGRKGPDAFEECACGASGGAGKPTVPSAQDITHFQEAIDDKALFLVLEHRNALVKQASRSSPPA